MNQTLSAERLLLERGIISLMIQDPECCDIAMQRLSRKHFKTDIGLNAFSVIGFQVSLGESVDLISVSDAIELETGDFHMAMLTEFINVNSGVYPSNFRGAVQKLREISNRDMLKIKFSAILSSLDQSPNTTAALEQFEALTIDLEREELLSFKSNYHDLGSDDVLQPILETIEGERESRDILRDHDLGKLFGMRGIVRGGISMIAARSKQGKTTALIALCDLIADQLDQTVFFHSLEMPLQSIGTAFLSNASQTARHKLTLSQKEYDETNYGYHLNDLDWARISDSMGRLINQKGRIYIDETQNINAHYIAKVSHRKAREIKRNPDLIVVDYLQLFGAIKGADPRNRRDTYEENLRVLKALAKSLDCAVIVLAQANRESAKRTHKEDGSPNKPPKAYEVEYCGAVEHIVESFIGIVQNEDEQGFKTMDFEPDAQRHGGEYSRGYVPMQQGFINLNQLQIFK